MQWNLFDRQEIGRYAADEFAPACIEALARETPQRVPAPAPTPLRAIPGSERSRLRVEVTRIRDGTQWRPASGECQLMVEGHLLGVAAGRPIAHLRPTGAGKPAAESGRVRFRRARPRRPAAGAAAQLRAGMRRGHGAARIAGGRPVVLDYAARRCEAAACATSSARIVPVWLRRFCLAARGGLTAEETEPYLVDRHDPRARRFGDERGHSRHGSVLS